MLRSIHTNVKNNFIYLQRYLISQNRHSRKYGRGRHNSLKKIIDFQYLHKQRYRKVIKLMIIYKSMMCPCLEYYVQQKKMEQKYMDLYGI